MNRQVPGGHHGVRPSHQTASTGPWRLVDRNIVQMASRPADANQSRPAGLTPGKATIVSKDRRSDAVETTTSEERQATLATVKRMIDDLVAAGVSHSEAMVRIRRDHNATWSAWIRAVAVEQTAGNLAGSHGKRRGAVVA